MSTTLTDPPPTPVRGTPALTWFHIADLARDLAEALPPPPQPLAGRFHVAHCVLCATEQPVIGRQERAEAFVEALAGAVADETDDPPVEFEAPTLTPGQARVFEGERARLFRLLDARTAPKTLAVLELLADMAGQAPAVGAVIAEEAARRRDTAAARPTLAFTLNPSGGAS